MDFGTFALLSLVFCVIGARVLWQVARGWSDLWDARYTAQDRLLISQAAFFLLVPVSVALHELGHAVAVWSFGGRVTDFGFYVYAGFVAYREPFTPAQQAIVAAAGTGVNIVLCAAAVWWGLVRRPAPRPPVADLLVQFALISGINALVIYPLLDFSSGLNGDFRQMYAFDAPAVSWAILAIHAAALGAGIWALRSPVVRARYDERAQRRPGGRRTGFGRNVATRPIDLRFAGPALPFPADSELGRVAARLGEASDRLAGGWPAELQRVVVPVAPAQGQPPTGVALLLRWTGLQDGGQRQLLAQSTGADLRLIGQGGGATAGTSDPSRLLAHEPLPGDEGELVLRLRLAMEQVEGSAAAG